MSFKQLLTAFAEATLDNDQTEMAIDEEEVDMDFLSLEVRA